VFARCLWREKGEGNSLTMIRKGGKKEGEGGEDYGTLVRKEAANAKEKKEL